MSISLTEQLKKVRKRLSYSQKDFAESLGIKQGTLSDIERGRIGVSPKVSKALFEKFKVNEGWFFTNEGEIFKVKNYNLKGSNEGLNEGFSDEIDQIFELNKKRFEERMQAKYSQFYQLSQDIVQILSAQEILRELGNSKLTQVIFFKGENLKKDIFYNDFKNISYQSFMEILPYKDFIHEYAEATRNFIDKLKEFKDEIDLNFEFE